MAAYSDNSNTIINTESRVANNSSNINSTVGPEPGNCESNLADPNDNMAASSVNSNTITNIDSEEVNSSSNINSTVGLDPGNCEPNLADPNDNMAASSVGPEPGNCESNLADPNDNMAASSVNSNTITNIDNEKVNSSSNINSTVGPEPSNYESNLADPKDNMATSSANSNTITNIDSGVANSSNSSNINSAVGPQPSNCDSILADPNDDMDASSTNINTITNIDNKEVKSRSIKWFMLVWSIIGLVLYVADLGAAIYSVVQHLPNSDYRWAGNLTIAFIVLPLIITGIPVSIVIVFGHGLLNENASDKPMLVNCCLIILAAPIAPFGMLVLNVIGFRQGRDIVKLVSPIKLSGALMHSYPQASLMLYIVFQKLHGEDAIEAWYWVTIAVSLCHLSFAVSTSDICEPDNKPAITSRMTWFVFGLLAVTSRLVVAGLYSMISSLLWIVPIATGLVSSIIMCCILTWCSYSMCVPLDEWYRYRCSSNICYAPLTWPLTAAYNGFTISGLVVSTINLAYAVGGIFLAVPQPIILTALSLSGASWVANILIIAVPCFKGIKKDWMVIGSDDKSSLY